LFDNRVFEEKDAAFGLYVGASGVDAQAAFALNKRSAMLANVSVLPGTSNYNYFGEVGLGNYHNLGQPQRWHFEYFGGGGLGFAKSSSTSIGGTRDVREASFGRFFVQPILGYNRALFETSIAVRSVLLSHLNYEDNNQALDIPAEFFFEPALTFRFGFGGEGFFENKKLSLQFGIAAGPNLDNLQFEYFPALVSFGFLWRPKRDY
jgi:hypothetical protein